MDSFAKYTIIDWIAFLQVLLIWFYMAYRSGQWIVSVACSKGWRWWNRKNKKALANGYIPRTLTSSIRRP